MKSGVWKFVTTDNYDLDDLLDYKKIFEQDLESANMEVIKHMRLQKWGIPNWRQGLVRRQVGVEESEQNLRIVNQAIELAKNREEQFKTKSKKKEYQKEVERKAKDSWR